jgi:AcrR family transcriptional regulator
MEPGARATGADDRDRILEALIRVIDSDGVADLSVPTVVREARVFVPTIYRHFGSIRVWWRHVAIVW